jgi:glutathione S-transferase
MKLLGTPASPFARRVRIVAAELGEPIEWVDAATEAGQAAMRELSPIWKIPIAVVDGRTLYDSQVIIDWLIATRGWGGLAPPRDAWHQRNQLTAIAESLNSMLQVFYLRRDGIPLEGNAFAQRQFDRSDAIFAWLARELTADAFGLAEASLICALDWMDFRNTYPTERAIALAPIRAAWAERPSVAATRPHA